AEQSGEREQRDDGGKEREEEIVGDPGGRARDVVFHRSLEDGRGGGDRGHAAGLSNNRTSPQPARIEHSPRERQPVETPHRPRARGFRQAGDPGRSCRVSGTSPTSACSTAMATASDKTAAESQSPADSPPAASASAPDTRGPSVWPTENTTVKNAMLADHARGSRPRRMISVMDDTTLRNPPPKSTAESSTPGTELDRSGTAVPAATIPNRIASPRPAGASGRSRGQANPDTNV